MMTDADAYQQQTCDAVLCRRRRALGDPPSCVFAHDGRLIGVNDLAEQSQRRISIIGAPLSSRVTKRTQNHPRAMPRASRQTSSSLTIHFPLPLPRTIHSPFCSLFRSRLPIPLPLPLNAHLHKRMHSQPIFPPLLFTPRFPGLVLVYRSSSILFPITRFLPMIEAI